MNYSGSDTNSPHRTKLNMLLSEWYIWVHILCLCVPMVKAVRTSWKNIVFLLYNPQTACLHIESPWLAPGKALEPGQHWPLQRTSSSEAIRMKQARIFHVQHSFSLSIVTAVWPNPFKCTYTISLLTSMYRTCVIYHVKINNRNIYTASIEIPRGIFSVILYLLKLSSVSVAFVWCSYESAEVWHQVIELLFKMNASFSKVSN